MGAGRAEQLLAERTRRLTTAVSLGTPDRVPTALVYDAFAARVTGVKLSDYVSSVALATKAGLETADLLEGMDAIQYPTANPAELAFLWLSPVDMPGKELPDDSLWQVREAGLMTAADYDLIVEMGFGPWMDDFVERHLGHLVPGLLALEAEIPHAGEEFNKRGIVNFCPGATTIPYEQLCGGRGIKDFMLDLHRIPDKVEAAMEAFLPVLKAQAQEGLRAARPIGWWVGGWRSASEFLSPRLWDRFVWPYLREMVETVAAEGVIPVLHLDSNWERDLARFRELPAGRCVLALDGATDIFKAKQVLGDHMCLLGDVPPRMLTLGTADEVKAYCRRLVREIGAEGFILAQGCAIPPDARLDNVRAMIEVAGG